MAEHAQCWCQTCRPITLSDMRMALCPDCGNKRCPRATNHIFACTGSNEPGQHGSVYGVTYAPTPPAATAAPSDDDLDAVWREAREDSPPGWARHRSYARTVLSRYGQGPVMNDSDLRYIQRVLESNAPDEDRERAAQMVRDMRRSQRTAPSEIDILRIAERYFSMKAATTGDKVEFARAILQRYGQAPAASADLGGLTDAEIDAIWTRPVSATASATVIRRETAELLIRAAALKAAPVAAQAPRPCTCHPDDRPDGPCREKYAASECQAPAANGDALDAARYRWLRRPDNPHGPSLVAFCKPDELDAAIDAAMQRASGGDHD